MFGIPVSINEIRTTPFDSGQAVADTIGVMGSLAKSAATSPQICSIVDSLVVRIPHNPSKEDLAREIYYWVKSHVRFREDEFLAMEMGYSKEWMKHRFGIDLLIHPLVLLSMNPPTGDCDDFSMLIASLLLAAHVPCMFKTIAADDEEPDRLSHVYVVALVDEHHYLAMDASHGSFPGWESRKMYRSLEWRI